MTTFTTLTSSDLDPDSPITTNLANAWYDNPLAIAQGDATVENANRIQPKALADTTSGNYKAHDSVSTDDVEPSLTTTYADHSGLKLYCPRAGIVNVRLILTVTGGTGASGTAYAKIYVTGVAAGTELSHAAVHEQTTSSTQDEDITVSAGDTLEIWFKRSSSWSQVADVSASIMPLVGNPVSFAEYTA